MLDQQLPKQGVGSSFPSKGAGCCCGNDAVGRCGSPGAICGGATSTAAATAQVLASDVGTVGLEH